MTNTITYQSQNAPAGQEWLAQLYMPNGQKWLVHAYGATEAEAVEKIVNLYNAERAKVDYQGKGDQKLDYGPANAVGRGSHFVGKTWLIHSFTRQKIRVDQNEVDKYISEGWLKGGPRSR